MKRSSLVISAVGLAAFVCACTPDIPQDPSQNLVVMEFDPGATPPVVPSPNDLAIDQTTGLVNVPTNPGDTPTQIEFNRTYLNTLDGFPLESTASVATSADLTASTLATGVLVLDITNPAAPVPVPATPSYVAGSKVLTIAPPGGQWTRGHHYAIVIKGGTQSGAVTGTNGKPVTGSAIWALVAGSVPLCALPDGGPGLPGSGCLATTDLIPSAEAAAQLEQLQLVYKPLLDALSVAPAPLGPLPRSNVAILWTFKIVSQAEVTFDPGNTVIPFPNDAVRQGPGGTVSLPVPPGTPPVLAQLIGGLNTLDGFSTTATITTAVDFDLANSPGASALMQGSVDPATVTFPLAIGFVDTGFGDGPSQGAPQVAVCVSDAPPGCPSMSPTLLDGGVKPQVVGIVPLTPLSERTTYAVYLTNAIRDTTGTKVIPSATMALVRLVQPLAINDSSCPAPAPPCKSQVSLLTDAQAALLVQLQEGLAPLFAQLALGGIPRTSVVLAWAFQTQSTVSALQQLAAAPYNPAAALPAPPLWTTTALSTTIRAQLTAAGVPTAAIATFIVGEFVDLFALTNSGTFGPGLAGAVPKKVPFIMTVPTSAAPAGGYPVTMFGHGLTGNKTQAYAIANALATAGHVMIAIDEVWHGERGTCTGYGDYLVAATGVATFAGQDQFACSNPTTMSCNSVGRCEQTNRTGLTACDNTQPTADETCLLAGQNECAPDDICEGGSFAASFSPAPGVNIPVSGWNLLNLSNLFATRDNFRQQVIDNSQFARMITAAATGNLIPGVALDATKLNYSGQSLGGILGTLYTSVAFNVHNAGLNVPGGNPVNILLTSPAFAAQKNGFLAGLAANGIIQDSPVYDIFIDVARWILDPADPTNAAFFTTHPTGITSPFGPSIPADRRTFVQWIVDDPVVPNPTTRQLIDAALHDPLADGLKKLPNTGPLFAYQFNGTSTPFSFNTTTILACTRHGFLLAPPPSNACSGAPGAPGLALTTSAQTQLVGFLSGAAPY